MSPTKPDSLLGFARCTEAYPIIDVSRCCTQRNNERLISGEVLMRLPGVAPTLSEFNIFSRNNTISQEQGLIFLV